MRERDTERQRERVKDCSSELVDGCFRFKLWCCCAKVRGLILMLERMNVLPPEGARRVGTVCDFLTHGQ